MSKDAFQKAYALYQVSLSSIVCVKKMASLLFTRLGGVHFLMRFILHVSCLASKIDMSSPIVDHASDVW